MSAASCSAPPASRMARRIRLRLARTCSSVVTRKRLAAGRLGQRVAGKAFRETLLDDAVGVGGQLGHLREGDEGDAAVEGRHRGVHPGVRDERPRVAQHRGLREARLDVDSGWDGRDRGSVQIADGHRPLPGAVADRRRRGRLRARWSSVHSSRPGPPSAGGPGRAPRSAGRRASTRVFRQVGDQLHGGDARVVGRQAGPPVVTS
jgi:hypothetical protein